MSVRQRGDTIVEVLLAMAVVGMVLGSSFGIANRSLNIGRSAQERTQALKIAESQLELMKIAEESGVSISTQTANFCLHVPDTTSGVKVVAAGSNECEDIEGLYTIVIDPDGANSSKVFEIRIIWERLGAANANAADRQDTLSIFYKIGQL